MSAEPVPRVIVATDFSETSERAVSVGAGYAQLLRATLDLVHVYPYPLAAVGVVPAIPGAVPVPFPGPEVLQNIGERLDAIAARLRESGAACITATLDGRAADAIVAYASTIAAALIVVGTHGRTGIRRAVLGSVAEEVLRKARCPVLVVPAAGDPQSL